MEEGFEGASVFDGPDVRFSQDDSLGRRHLSDQPIKAIVEPNLLEVCGPCADLS